MAQQRRAKRSIPISSYLSVVVIEFHFIFKRVDCPLSFIAQREREYVDVKPLKNSSSKQILIYKQIGVCFSFTCCEKQNQRT